MNQHCVKFPPLSGYIDSHCHRPRNHDDLEITSIDVRDFRPGDAEHGFYTLGIHPWFIEGQDTAKAMEMLSAAGHDPNLLAIGECGLDKCIATPLELQIEVLIRQIELAERIGKPLIIHCVRAFNELLQIKKARKIQSNWIIHGFNANPKLAAQLIKHGCYLSFGSALLNPRSHAGNALALTPVDRLFLETDTSDLTIGEIYATAAKMLGIGEVTLRRQILNNFKRVFLQ